MVPVNWKVVEFVGNVLEPVVVIVFDKSFEKEGHVVCDVARLRKVHVGYVEECKCHDGVGDASR